MSRDYVTIHVERCMELYGMPLDEDLKTKTVSRPSYEQMRADLMVAIGMLMALRGDDKEPKP